MSSKNARLLTLVEKIKYNKAAITSFDKKEIAPCTCLDRRNFIQLIVQILLVEIVTPGCLCAFCNWYLCTVYVSAALLKQNSCCLPALLNKIYFIFFL